MNREAIALVGIGCRFPGARGPRELWRLLSEGREAVAEVPPERLALAAAAAACRGGFLDDADRFDAAFFGLTPREAATLDPQQRLLTEVAWEALEDAGLVPERLAGSAAGVFLALGAEEYAELAARGEEPDVATLTGGLRGVAAGRLAQRFGFEGPALVVDTDRSSSLVAVHLACRSLWSGESSLALAGGVNLVLLPRTHLAFARAGMLSADGRSKAFAADADGFVRAEGAGVVVLKPLSRARADGDAVYALIVGSAVRSDGGRGLGAGGSLLAPSQAGQEAVLRAALEDAEVEPGSVDYVEAHGTGTPRGDLVEARAVGAVYGRGRDPARPCRIGSIKTNLGHAETAAGIAGLVKTALVLAHRELPASLHCDEPRPDVDWRELALEVQRRTEPWPDGGVPARAGVSAFGIAGTNAHVVLEEAPTAAVEARDLPSPPRAELLTLSAASAPALAALARGWSGWLARGEGLDEPLADVCATAGRRRVHHAHRLAVAGRGHGEIGERLAAWTAGEGAAGLAHGVAGTAPRVAFVFPGQGSQWPGMGRRLLAEEPVFRAALERCDAAIARETGWSVLAELRAPESPRLADVDVVQPVTFALQVALAALWRSWGVEPAAVVGQSLGEVAAACVAGALELDDAAAVICRRSRLLKRLAGRGAMLTVELAPAVARRRLAGRDEIAVAVCSSPTSCVLSGERAALERLAGELDGEGVFQRFVQVGYASHGPRMEELREELTAELAGLRPRAAAVPIFSTVEAGPVDGGGLDAAYWMKNLRQPVRFVEAVDALLAAGHDAFVELSAHPIATGAVEETAHEAGRPALVVPSMRRGEDGREVMLRGLGALHARGAAVDAEALWPTGRPVRTPPYPFQRQRFWIEDEQDEPAAGRGGSLARAWAPPAAPADAAETVPAAAFDRAALLAAPAAERHRRLELFLRQQAARVLGLAAGRLEPSRPLVRQGLDSLMAVSLRHRLERGLGAAPTTSELLSGTLAELCRRLEEGLAAADGEPPAGGTEAAEAPLSPGQEALWFLHRLAPENTGYHIAFLYRVESPLDTAALRRAVDALVRRHPALCSTFPSPGGKPRQRVDPRREVSFTVRGAAGRGLGELTARAAREADRPFDLERGPLLRVAVWTRAPEDHVLLLAAHHVVADFWSMEVVLRDLGALYSGGGAELPSLERGYADYARGERRWLRRSSGPAFAHWQRRLTPLPPALALATDRPRPPRPSYRGGSVLRLLSAELTAAVRGFGDARGGTLFATLLAVFQTLLHRHTGQDDLVVGTPTAGRHEADLAEVVGYFVNPLALRADLAGDPAFDDFAAAARRRTLQDFDHQRYPFSEVVERLRPERELSRPPLIQVMLVLQKARDTALGSLVASALGRGGVRLETGGLRLTTLDFEERGARFDLTLMAAVVGGRLETALQYGADLFDATTARRMLGCFESLLADAVARPGRRLSELAMLSPAERQALLEWNARPPSPDAPRCLHELFEEQAGRTPEAVAVVWGARRTSYGELRGKARRIASRLRRLGVGPEARVGILARRSDDTVAALLGILQAGGAYVPLDPAYPPRRLAFLLEDAGIQTLLTSGDTPALPAAGLRRLRIADLLAPDGAPEPAGAPGSPEPENLAYVLYTSGSTGRPKGVALTHRNATALVSWALRAFSPAQLRVVLASTSLCFDLSVFELFVPLAQGGRVVLADGVLALPGLPAAGEVTLVNTVPSALRQLLREGLPSSVSTVNLAGEPLRQDLAESLLESSSVDEVRNLYGPTEDTTYSTWTVLRHPPVRPPAIGRPVDGTRVHLLDPRGRPVAVGAVGELCLAGDGLARGYLDRPAWTAGRFVPDPWSESPGGRLYRTGDRARHLGDGELAFLGRFDHQVKVRGFRVEPGEVEACLEEHPAVREALVEVRSGPEGHRRLVAWVGRDPRRAAADRGREHEHVGHWRSFYERLYASGAPGPDDFDLRGWESSYTGRPIPRAEMREWVESTVERILALGPRHVLEIGCGTGLLLERIAPRCRRYVATDFSREAIDALSARPFPQVELRVAPAHDLTGLPEAAFDTVILNSVAQYFPSAAYLAGVLRGACRVAAPGASIFLGDVRSRALADVFSTAVELERAPGDLPLARLEARIARRRWNENELLADPGFFLALGDELPRLGGVRIELKRGRCHNELTRFRYDVTLLLDRPAAEPSEIVWCDWNDEELDPDVLRRRLRQERPAALGLARVPNPRLLAEIEALSHLARASPGIATAADLRAACGRVERGGVEPEELALLAQELSYDVAFDVAEDAAGGTYGAVLQDRAGGRPATPWCRAPGDAGGWRRWANDPLRAERSRRLAPELRRHLEERLPRFLVPAVVRVLDELPRLPNGKVDRRALPDPGAPATARGTAPRDRAERELVRIWSEVLGLERAGIHDDFFHLGGDSILSLQIVSRARQSGFHFEPEDLFRHRTVAELARAAAAAAPRPDAAGTAVSGPVPLTPIQRWFLDRDLPDPGHFNQAQLLAARRPLEPALLSRASSSLMARHEALRLRWRRGEAGWEQELLPDVPALPCPRVDLSRLGATAIAGRAFGATAAALEAAADRLQASLDLAAAPWRMAWFDLGGEHRGRLLLVAHHLLVDGVSWRVLLEDLASAYQRLEAGAEPELPAPTTPFREHAERLAEHASSAELASELDHWCALPSPEPLARDFHGGENTLASAAVVTASLPVRRTGQLLRRAPAASGARINDLLLTALARAFRRRSGSGRLLLELEGHGREPLSGDVSRTVGWFTTAFPVLLDLGTSGDPGEELEAVRATLEALPRRGLGYGLLRYLSPAGERVEALRRRLDPEVNFNYMGQLDSLYDGSALFRRAPEGSGRTQGRRGARHRLIEVHCAVLGGRLRVDWTYSRALHARTTIEALADGFLAELEALVEHCLGVVAAGEPFEDLCPLTPMQQGLLLESLTSAAPLYLEQRSWTLRGRLDHGAFRRAWRRLAERHDALRTSVVWEGLPAPLQKVHRWAEPEWVELDWRNGTSPAADVETRLAELGKADRGRGFDRARAPLVRMTLVRLDDEVHRWIWSYDHLVLDGWSNPVLLGELGELYEAERRGEERELPAAPSFRDYARWLGGRDPARDEAFWRRALAGFTTPTPIGGTPVPAGDAYARRKRVLDPASTRALRELARRRGLTLGTLAQAAWGLLLGRYSGTDDVVFGVTVSVRPPELPGAADLVGLCINTLPVRVRGSAAAPDLASWLDAFQEELLELRRHDTTPLAEVQRWSEVPPGRPLFESLLVFENYPDLGRQQAGGEGLAMDDWRTFSRTAYPWTLMVLPGEEIEVEIGFDPRRFPPSAMERLLEHYLRLLAAFPGAAGLPPRDLKLSSPGELHQLLVEHNDTARAELLAPGDVVEMLEDRLRRAGDAAALTFEGRTWSYRELHREAGELARGLRGLGVGPEVRVGLCCPRGPELVIAVLGILKAGGAYVPLDPDHPRERRDAIAADAGVSLVVTGPLDAAAPGPREEPAASRADNLAYVLYTSGSTGRPKGVEISRRSLTHFLRVMAERPGLGAGDRLLAVTTVAFDIAALELLLPLVVGARLELAPRSVTQDGQRLAAALRRGGATHLQATPATWRLILAALAPGDKLAGLVALSGGETLDDELARRLRERGAEVWNLYGPTETTIWSTGERVAAGPVTLGRPIANTRCYVVDRRLRPMPAGAAGELYLAGAGLARGYRGRPGLTAEGFLPDPFAARPGERMYRTGDRARRLPDGRLEFLGRIDHQVKIRGYRIEPGEIEAVLAAHPRVRESVVVARDAGPAGQKLVAWVVLADAAGDWVADLRGHLRTRLPDYMVPAAFLDLERLPRNASGKVDRRALPAPEGKGAAAPPAAPRGATERRLAVIWQEVLGLEEVGVEESFFDLGGHSLLLFAVHARLRQELGVDVAIVELLRLPTIRALARRLRREEEGAGRAASAPRRRAQQAVARRQQAVRRQARVERSTPEGSP